MWRRSRRWPSPRCGGRGGVWRACARGGRRWQSTGGGAGGARQARSPYSITRALQRPVLPQPQQALHLATSPPHHLTHHLTTNPALLRTPTPACPPQAKMFQFDKAADLLDLLVKLKPQEGEAWRLLGETSLLAQQSARSVAAYEQAVALKDGDLQVTTVGWQRLAAAGSGWQEIRSWQRLAAAGSGWWGLPWALGMRGARCVPAPLRDAAGQGCAGHLRPAAAARFCARPSPPAYTPACAGPGGRLHRQLAAGQGGGVSLWPQGQAGGRCAARGAGSSRCSSGCSRRGGSTGTGVLSGHHGPGGGAAAAGQGGRWALGAAPAGARQHAAAAACRSGPCLGCSWGPGAAGAPGVLRTSPGCLLPAAACHLPLPVTCRCLPVALPCAGVQRVAGARQRRAGGLRLAHKGAAPA
jgi:hypothetical protein